MAGHFQNFEVGAEKISVRRFLKKKIWFHWLDFEPEPEAAKEIAIGNHRGGEWVTPNLAAELVLDLRNVLDVIDVPVCQQQEFGMDIERADPFAGALRCVEQDPSLRRFEQVAIGFKNPAAKCLRFRHVESLNRDIVTSDQVFNNPPG
jgi:hypothetical protein